jgi:S1-C subfamily serine protease
MTPDSTLALQQHSDGLAAAVDRAAGWTVLVGARRRIPASGLMWSADGLIVTADHAIEDEDGIVVGMPSGDQVKASLVGRDPGADLALLRVEGATTVAPELAPEGATLVGHLVLAVGRPAAGNVQASLGVASAIGGPWRSRSGTQVDGYLRTDTTFFPGFSGGPLIDVQGRVLGVNSSRFRGRGLTIAASAVTKIVALLRDHGRVRRAYLGIASQGVRLPVGAAGGQETGLLLVNVEADSPAGRAGLVLGDVLIGIDGSLTRNAEDLQSLLGPERVGATVRLQLLRGGAPHEVSALLSERP